MESHSDENVGERKRLNDISKEMLKERKNPNLRFRFNASVPSEGEVALLPSHAEQENKPNEEDERLISAVFKTFSAGGVEYGYCEDGPGFRSLRSAFEAPSPTATEGRVERGFLDKYERRAMAVAFFVLEFVSFMLDVYGKNKWSFLLPAFILSAFGFGITVYTSILKKSHRQIGVLEIVFSVVQLIVTFIYFILAVLGVKNNFSVSVFPLVFAIILVVFAFQKNTEDTAHSWRHANESSFVTSPVNSGEHEASRHQPSEPAVEISNDFKRIVLPNTIDSQVSVSIENDNPSRSRNIGSGSSLIYPGWANALCSSQSISIAT